MAEQTDTAKPTLDKTTETNTTENTVEEQQQVSRGKKRTSSALEEGGDDEHVAKFGSRLLNNEQDVFSQNAWYV